MDGFKSSQKMQCFKEGGAVKYKSRHSEKSEMSKDIAQDKKVVKKAFAMHDKQSHEGEKTDLKKLNKGGRMKKDSGCVGRYQAGGSIKMKKDAADIKDIQKIKLTKTKKAAAPSKAAIKPAMSNIAEPAMSADMGMAPPPMMKKGKSVKKYNAGKSVSNEVVRESTLGKPITSQQKEMVKEQSIKPGTLDFPYSKTTSKKYSEMKKGGKAKKYNTGGGVMDAVKSVGKKLYENVMGTPEQNKAAAEQEKAIAEKDPSSYEAKYRNLTGKK